MTTIGSQDDFLRALSENPQWKAAIRAQILGEELLQLPAKFDAFVEQMSVFVAEQKQFNAEMKSFVAVQKEINERIGKRLDGIDDSVGWLKGYVTQEVAIREAAATAMDMGLEYVRTIPREDLYRMALKAAEGTLLTNELKSFRRADLVIEATDGETVQYIAVEVSFTGGSRDTNRALRNASFLTELTGLPARAAIASVRNNDSISWQITSGAVYWHELEERDLALE